MESILELYSVAARDCNTYVGTVETLSSARSGKTKTRATYHRICTRCPHPQSLTPRPSAPMRRNGLMSVNGLEAEPTRIGGGTLVCNHTFGQQCSACGNLPHNSYIAEGLLPISFNPRSRTRRSAESRASARVVARSSCLRACALVRSSRSLRISLQAAFTGDIRSRRSSETYCKSGDHCNSPDPARQDVAEI
jgi:hypothetical protein